MNESTNMRTEPASKKNSQEIDLRAIGTKLWNKRKVFYWVLPITFVVSSALILCVPREYQSQVVLAPEMKNSLTNGTLGDLASSFGFNVGDLNGEDAIYPTIYPEVFDSPDFLMGLWSTPVHNADQTIACTYYEYLADHQKYPWWKMIVNSVRRSIRKLLQKEGNAQADIPDGVRWLTLKQRLVLELMHKRISCDVNKKTEIITVTIRDQDPLIAAIMAKNAAEHIQRFITTYRTQKVATNMEYYHNLLSEVSAEYTQANEQYVRYVDSHSNIGLERYKSEANALKQKADLHQSILSGVEKQYISSKAKMQEQTPVFTTIQSAGVPERPCAPKRMWFVLGMCFAAFVVTSLILTKDEWIARNEP